MKSRNIHPSLRSIWRNPIHFVACGCGIGAIPIMPGTFGTLGGVALYCMLSPLPLLVYLIIAVALFVVGCIICGVTNRDFGTDDHPAAVWDEIVGFLFVMIAVPKTWYFILAGFVLFRIFDIWKPWPIGWIDRHVHGGIGVMLDDIVAAAFSCILLHIAVAVLH